MQIPQNTGKEVEIHTVNLFTNRSSMVTLGNGVPFHDTVALQILSGDFKEKTVLSDTTYCYIQWLRGFSIKGSVIPLCTTFPEMENQFVFPHFQPFSVSQGSSIKLREKIAGEKNGNEGDS